MKQYNVGDEIKVYEIIGTDDFKQRYTGKQVAALSDYGLMIQVPLKSTYSEDAHPSQNLLYYIINGTGFHKEAKHVCTMRITKLKK